MKRAIISGATGAIGMALISHLVKEKVKVLVLYHGESKRIDRIPDHPLVEKMKCSLEEMADIKYTGTEEYDIFYHFAWNGTSGNSRNDINVQDLNIKYTLDAVRLAKRFGCSSFIGAGSQAEYGRVEGKLTPDTPAFPENGYGIAKLCAGQLSRILCSQLKIRHIWVRILSVYGPYDAENTLVISTIKKLMNGKPTQFTKGEQMWDFLYSGDAAEAFYKIAEKGKDDAVYCLGGGIARPLKDYIIEIKNAINPAAELEFGRIPYNEKQVMYLCADISKLTEDTGFISKTAFEDGIRKTVASII